MITLHINSPGGDCIAASQIYSVKELYGQLSEYQKLKDSGDSKGAATMLENIQKSAAELDQSQLTEFYTVLSQIQGLADDGVDVTALFPEEDLKTPLNTLASISEYLTQFQNELPGLNSMINDTLANDIREIMVDLNMTKAEDRWSNFATNPGAVTTDAVINSYEDAEAAKALAPVCEAAVDAYVESPEGTTKPTPDGFKAYVNEYLEKNGVSTDELRPENITAMVSQYAKKTGLDNDSEALKALEPFVTAWIEEYANKPGTDTPAEIQMKVRLNRLDRSELTKFTALNQVKLKAEVVRAGTEFGSVEDLFKKAEDGGNIKFYKDGVEVPVNVVKAEGGVSLNSLLGVDENGVFHVLIVPEYGDAGAIEAARNALTGDSAQTDKGPFSFLFKKDTQSEIHNAAESLRQVFDTTQPKSIERLEQAQAALTRLSAFDSSSESGSNLADYVGNLVAAIKQGQSISAEDYQNLQDIMTVLQGIEQSGMAFDVLQSISDGLNDSESMTDVGESLSSTIQTALDGANVSEAAAMLGGDVAAGAGQGMTEYSFDSDAETVASNIDSSLRSAESSHSPAQRTVPIGNDIAAGIGEGLSSYSWVDAANAVAANVEAAFFGVTSSGRFSNIGIQAMMGVGNGMRNFNWSSIMRTVANRILSALKSNISISDYVSVGHNMMSGIARGINEGRSSVVDAMVSAVRDAISAAKATAQIESPSRVFENEVGVMMMRGVSVGVEKEAPLTAGILSNATRYLTDVARGSVASNVSNDNRRNYDNRQSFNVTQNIYAENTSYAEQQRLAARNLMDIARRI